MCEHPLETAADQKNNHRKQVEITYSRVYRQQQMVHNSLQRYVSKCAWSFLHYFIPQVLKVRIPGAEDESFGVVGS